jgi:Lrp/AsnC family transcriptional regulator of ectoine degradation
MPFHCHALWTNPPGHHDRHKLDAIDLKILDAIQRDGRITKLALAEKVRPFTHAMLDAPAQAGKGRHHLRLSRAWVALRCVAPVATVLMEVTLGATTGRPTSTVSSARVRDQPEIVACWSVGGGVDYMLKVVAARHRRLSAPRRQPAGTRNRHRSLLHLHRHQDGEGGDRAAAGDDCCHLRRGAPVERLSTRRSLPRAKLSASRPGNNSLSIRASGLRFL